MISAIGIPQLILLSAILAIAATLGRRLLSRLAFDSWLEKIAFSTALGLGFISYLTFLLGVLQLYSGGLFKVLLGLALLLCLPLWLKRWRALPSRQTAARTGQWLATVLLLLLLAGCLLAALSPETEFDALNYHLGIPQRYLALGGIQDLPNLFYSSFPQALEMLFTLGLLLDSVILAKLFHFAFAVITVVAIVSFSRRYLSPLTGLLAALVFIASPIVASASKTANVDLGLTAFVFLSLYAFYNWTHTSHGGWLSLAAVLSGLAVGTKYSGVIAIFLVTAGFFWFWPGRHSDRAKPRPRTLLWRKLLLYHAIALLVVSPWLIKNLVFSGNPVAPFFSDIMYNAHLTPEDYRTWVGVMKDWAGLEPGFWNYVRSPWLLTFHPDRFGGSPGFVYLFLFPPAIVLGRRNRTLAFLIVCAVLGYLLLILGTKQVRFYMPLFPLMSIAISGALLSGVPLNRYLRGGLVLIVFGLMLLGSLRINSDTIKLFRSQSERRAYLEKRLPGEKALEFYDYLNKGLPKGASVLALSTGFQALTEHPLYMSPNCSLANQLSQGIVQASIRTPGFFQVRLMLPENKSYRLWKVPAGASQPRFYRKSGDLFLPVDFNRAGGTAPQDRVVDLGSPYAVAKIEYLVSEHPGKMERQAALFASNGPEWQPVSFSMHLDPPSAFQLNDLIRNFQRGGIRYLFYIYESRLLFIHDFFQLAESRKHLRLIGKIGNYHLYEVVP